MTITTDLDAWWGTLTDYEESNTSKAKFQEIMTTIDQYLDELEAMNAVGDFNMLPATVKTKFIWAWQQLNTVRSTLKGDADFMEALSWRP